jgi:hypothetical protein
MKKPEKGNCSPIMTHVLMMSQKDTKLEKL